MTRLLFFFSSRRRHTRCLSDWSSDVCSSDLLLNDTLVIFGTEFGRTSFAQGALKGAYGRDHHGGNRSEERRVGKECRSRRSPEHLKKKQCDEGENGTNTCSRR